MKLQNSRIAMLVLIGVLFLSVSSAYAETAEEYFQRGFANGKQGNLPQAISDYTRAITMNPNYAAAYCNRGMVYDLQGNYIQAISDYTKAIAINPKDALSYKGRGLAYYLIKEYDKAWADVHKAEELGYKVNPEFLQDLKKVSGKDK